MVRGVDFSESSRIVTLLTPSRGRLACLAKGARRPKSPLSAILDTFNRVEVVYYWKEGRAVHTLGEAALLDGYGGIKSALDKSAWGAFALEVASRVAHEDEPSEELFAALVQGLDTLAAWRGDVRGHTCWHVWRLLCAAGFAPARTHCGLCGGALAGTPGFSFDAGVTCGTCRGERRVSEEGLAALRGLDAAAASAPSGVAAGELFLLLRHYAARQLDTDFRSVRVIDELFGAR